MATFFTVVDLTVDDVFEILRCQLDGSPWPKNYDGLVIEEVEFDTRQLVVTMSDNHGATRAFEVNEYGVNLHSPD